MVRASGSENWNTFYTRSRVHRDHRGPAGHPGLGPGRVAARELLATVRGARAGCRVAGRLAGPLAGPGRPRAVRDRAAGTARRRRRHARRPAAAVEQAAEDLVPGPVLPTVLAALLLVDTPAEELARRFGAGAGTAGVALDARRRDRHAGRRRRRRRRHHRPRARRPRRGAPAAARPRPGRPAGLVRAAAARGVLSGAARLLPAAGPGHARPGRGARGPGARRRRDRRDVAALAATLFAAEAAGVARWCLRTAVEYAKVREQFGRPIGSFQAVKHLCAEMLCRCRAGRRARLGRGPRPPLAVRARGRRRRARRRRRQREGLRPGARRHRLHLGARRPPVPAPRASLPASSPAAAPAGGGGSPTSRWPASGGP